jgi:hypothetical protein
VRDDAQRKADEGHYTRVSELADDVRLVFTNCTTYNKPESDIVLMSNILSQVFEQRIKPIIVEDVEYQEQLEQEKAEKMEKIAASKAAAAAVAAAAAAAATTASSSTAASTASKRAHKRSSVSGVSSMPTHPADMQNEIQTLRDSVLSMQQVLAKLQQNPIGLAAPTTPAASRPPPRVIPMTQEEKQNLSQLIQSDKLGSEHLAGIVKIIKEKTPTMASVCANDNSQFLSSLLLSSPLYPIADACVINRKMMPMRL